MDNKPANSLLMVGNLLSSTVGNRAICEEMSFRMAARGWYVVTTSTRPRRVPRLFDMLFTCLARRHHYRLAQVDVFSGPAFFWAEAVCALLRLIGKPYVLVLRGGALPRYLRLWPRRVSRLLGSADAVVAPSSYLKQEMSACRPDIKLIPNAIDISAYPFQLRNQPAPRLVWLRSFHRVYNPSMAVQVLSILARDFPQATLLMVGPDKHDGSLRQAVGTAGALGVADRVTFQGAVHKSQVARWINRGDIFLNTTNVDNTPVSVVEAMACGACVVSTNVGGIPHLLEHGRDALLAPPRDPEAMAAAVRRLLTESGLAARLSANARTKAEGFDWSAVLSEWENLLTSLDRKESTAAPSGSRLSAQINQECAGK